MPVPVKKLYREDIVYEALRAINVESVSSIKDLDDFIQNDERFKNRQNEYMHLKRASVRSRFYSWLNTHTSKQSVSAVG